MIFIGADHRGYNLKEVLKIYLKELSLECEDLGAKKFNPEDDYPDFALTVAKKVAENPEDGPAVMMTIPMFYHLQLIL
ncbi:MAG: Ribose 5-phosphate isomerase [Candidatus Azambacteria bacterium GW2011_GWA2_39_10]|uniref:Ribose 5-phosphate isomerase n=1 Tax=Candidatus Azambacteria bacterium GW2011_GWA2_39_10 TaxID=1618611 RepID=A0A0G0LY35_9BACT|nr:MAG: Ribose 5-phosphate isomerase [Candidatus Azambacteria bacterium GW2011_GWA2_39_10]